MRRDKISYMIGVMVAWRYSSKDSTCNFTVSLKYAENEILLIKMKTKNVIDEFWSLV